MFKNILFSIVMLFCLSANSCKRVLHKVSTNHTSYQIKGNSAMVDKEVEDLIRPYKTDLDLVMNEVLGVSMQDMPKRKPESLLGNWMADAIQEHAEKTLGKQISFAVQNYGGIRIPIINKGPITRGKIFELMPFDNTIEVLNLDGKQVETFIRHMLERNGWPVSHSLRVKYLNGILDVEINEESLDYSKEYLVAVPDYIANGGSDCNFLLGTEREILNALIRNVLVDYVKNKGNLDPKIEGRFVIKN